MALVYGNLSAVYLNLDEFDKAIDFNDKSMAIQQKRGDFIEQLSRSYRYILEQKEQSLVTLRTGLEFMIITKLPP
jgi:hypothetical protein